MTPAQERKYFRLWRDARNWYRSHGLTPQAADAKRHDLHVKALGYDKPHMEMTNAEIDKVFGEFLAISDGGDLNAQMKQNEQPEMRRNRLRSRAIETAMLFVDASRQEFRERSAIKYVEGICRRMSFPPLHDCTEAQLGKIVGVVERTARVRGKLTTVDQEAERLAKADNEPF